MTEPTFREFASTIERISGRVLIRGRLPIAIGDFQFLRNIGITKAVNFESGLHEILTRTINDEVYFGRHAGIDVIHIRFNPILPPSLRDLDLAVQTLIALLVEGNVYFHCKRGKERTGMVAACWRIRQQDWSVERAVDEMHHVGFSHLFDWWIPQLYRYRRWLRKSRPGAIGEAP